jgi:hypothetical protein
MYIRSLVREDDKDERVIHRDRAKNLGAKLITELKAFNTNRN